MRLMGIVMILSGVLALGDAISLRAQRVMVARKVSPVPPDPKEIGDRKARKARRVMLARQHRLLSEL